MILTNALPTMTPSAPAAITRFACSGFEIPKPTASGILPVVKGCTLWIRLMVESSTDAFVPVTPKCETRYRKPELHSTILGKRLSVVDGAAEEYCGDICAVCSFSVIVSFFNRQIWDNDSVNVAAAGGGEKLFQAHLENRVVVCHDNNWSGVCFFDFFRRFQNNFGCGTCVQGACAGCLYGWTISDGVREGKT